MGPGNHEPSNRFRVLGTYTRISPMTRVLGTVLAALLGLAFGSFLNVCLSRWPEGLLEIDITPEQKTRKRGKRVLALQDAGKNDVHVVIQEIRSP